MTFLTNILQILDIPHHIYLSLKRCCSKNKKYYEEDIIDDWYFDLGYHYAFAVVAFTMIFIFSASAPLIPVFGFLFFTFKYYIDKYNFVFVYPTEFISRGIFANAVSKYSTIGLFLF